MIYENGELVAETERFSTSSTLIVADVDIERLQQERVRQTSFADAIDAHRPRRPFREIEFMLSRPHIRSRPAGVLRFPFAQGPMRYQTLSEAFMISRSCGSGQSALSRQD